MISVATYEKGPSVAQALVSETVLEAFRITAGKEGWDSSCLSLVDEDYVRRFISESEHIYTPTKRVKAKTVRDLMTYIRWLVYALEDGENLYQFSAFGEMILEEILEIATRKIDAGEAEWIIPGTFNDRKMLYLETIQRAEELNFMFGEDYNTVEYAMGMMEALLNPEALTRDVDCSMIFIHEEDRITFWDASKSIVPQFCAATKPVEEAESESLLESAKKTKKKAKIISYHMLVTNELPVS